MLIIILSLFYKDILYLHILYLSISLYNIFLYLFKIFFSFFWEPSSVKNVKNIALI